MFRSPWQQGMHIFRAFSSSNINRVKMAFNVYGERNGNSIPPLIIMHGLFGSKQNWRGVCKALEKKLNRTIYAVDARNHGDSPHTSEHSSQDMAADVVEFMKQENVKKASVLGHSMGGRTMMYLALKYPELVDRGIIVDISPISIPGDFMSMERIFEAMENISVSRDLSMAEGRKVLATQLLDAVGSKGTVEFIMLNLKKKATGEFHWGLNVEALHKNLRLFSDFKSQIEGLPHFNEPMAFVCGSASNYVDPDNWPDIQKIFPNSEIHWLDAGHLVHFDQPVQFIDLIVRFLNK